MASSPATVPVGTESASSRARRRARADLIREIVETARRQLAVEGAAALSLRAVARELGMVSSAVYRYVASRDELLTLLIIDAYDGLGAAVERAEARVPREDLAGRFRAICTASRRWALRHPHEYALIYGSPVPGYAAPQETVAPATRVTRLLAALLADRRLTAGAAGVAALPDHGPAVHRALAPVRAVIPDAVPDELVLRGIMAWTYLFGAVTFELFGHLHNVIADSPTSRDAFFDVEVARLAQTIGLA